MKGSEKAKAPPRQRPVIVHTDSKISLSGSLYPTTVLSDLQPPKYEFFINCRCQANPVKKTFALDRKDNARKLPLPLFCDILRLSALVPPTPCGAFPKARDCGIIKVRRHCIWWKIVGQISSFTAKHMRKARGYPGLFVTNDMFVQLDHLIKVSHFYKKSSI